MSPPPDAATLAGWLDGICSARGVTPAAPTTPGVEVVRREAGGRSWLFAINHSGTEATVPTAAGPVTVAPGAVVVVPENRHAHDPAA
jgi:beta-galactosidase